MIRYRFRPYRHGYLLTAYDGPKVASLFIMRPSSFRWTPVRRVFRDELRSQLQARD